MWQCTCWNTQNATGEMLNFGVPDLIIPFVVSVEIGLFCMAELFKDKNPIYDDHPLPVGEHVQPTATPNMD